MRVVKAIGLALFFAILLAPIIWTVLVSLGTGDGRGGEAALAFAAPGIDNYVTVLTSAPLYSGYVHSAVVVSINTAVSLAVALPAAYALSRHRFFADRTMLYWLMAMALAPSAALLLPYLELTQRLAISWAPVAVALAHLLFNVPVAVWLLEGVMSRVPRALDEMAYLDGYSFPRFFLTVFVPQIATGIAVTAAFCLILSWSEFLLARTLAPADAKPLSATMVAALDAGDPDWGVIAAAGVLGLAPAVLIAWLIRHFLAKGWSFGRL